MLDADDMTLSDALAYYGLRHVKPATGNRGRSILARDGSVLVTMDWQEAWAWLRAWGAVAPQKEG